MAQIKGIDILIMVETGEGTFTKVAGQRGATLNRSADTLETTNKDTEGWKDFETAYKEWSIDADGLYVSDDNAYQVIEQAFMNSERIMVQMATPSGEKYQGEAVITDLPIEAPYDDMATYSVTIQGSGKLEKVTA